MVHESSGSKRTDSRTVTIRDSARLWERTQDEKAMASVAVFTTPNQRKALRAGPKTCRLFGPAGPPDVLMTVLG